MIAINELRIGNWVQIDDTPFILNSIDKSGIINGLMTDKSDVNTIIEIVSPVPLTEEILLKCGFERQANGKIYLEVKTDNDTLEFFVDTEGVNVTFACYYGLALTNINSLHHLQNAYFSLTNQELKIEL